MLVNLEEKTEQSSVDCVMYHELIAAGLGPQQSQEVCTIGLRGVYNILRCEGNMSLETFSRVIQILRERT